MLWLPHLTVEWEYMNLEREKQYQFHIEETNSWWKWKWIKDFFFPLFEFPCLGIYSWSCMAVSVVLWVPLFLGISKILNFRTFVNVILTFTFCILGSSRISLKVTGFWFDLIRFDLQIYSSINFIFLTSSYGVKKTHIHFMFLFF